MMYSTLRAAVYHCRTIFWYHLLLQQEISSHTVTIIRIWWFFAELFGRIRIHYSAYYSDAIKYELNIRYSPTHFTIPQRVEGWANQGSWSHIVICQVIRNNGPIYTVSQKKVAHHTLQYIFTQDWPIAKISTAIESEIISEHKDVINVLIFNVPKCCHLAN